MISSATIFPFRPHSLPFDSCSYSVQLGVIGRENSIKIGSLLDFCRAKWAAAEEVAHFMLLDNNSTHHHRKPGRIQMCLRKNLAVASVEHIESNKLQLCLKHAAKAVEGVTTRRERREGSVSFIQCKKRLMTFLHRLSTPRIAQSCISVWCRALQYGNMDSLNEYL